MAVAKSRPVNLNLISFRFPPMALISIGHRVSGFVLFLLLPLALYLLSMVTHSASDFSRLRVLLDAGWMRCVNWIMLLAMAYHVIAGVRHLIMDMGWGESLQASRCSAYGVMVLFVIVVALTGVWIW